MDGGKNLESAISRGTTQNDHASIENRLSQYSDAQKAKAFRKLDWNLILLLVLLSIAQRAPG